MKSMRARILAAFFLIIGLNILFISASFIVGYRYSINRWDKTTEKEARFTLEVLFSRLLYQDVLTEEDCRKSLIEAQQHLMGVAQLDIYSVEKKLIYSWRNTSLEHYTYQQPDPASVRKYLYNDDLIGYYHLVPVEFRFYEQNRRFASRIIHAAFLGMLLTMAGSLFLAHRLTVSFTTEARETARNLINLSQGTKGLEPLTGKTSEMVEINNAALRLQEKLLKEENQRIRWFENISHDMRTPITAMKSQFIACRDGILPMTQERWDTILKELGGMENMIRDFTLLSRLETAEFKLNRQYISTMAVKEHLKAGSVEIAKERGVIINWNVQAFSFLCDFTLLTLAFSHLIRNAVQHSPAGSEISVALIIEAGKGMFRVINEGQLSEDQMERIFYPLYKADPSRNARGSGMGLTISQKIAEHLGAKLNVNNLDDHKISFEMSLLACSSTIKI